MNWFEAIVNKMGGEKEAERFLRGETALFNQHELREDESSGILHFSVRSTGISGSEWVERLRSKRVHLEPDVQRVLLSKDFVPTSGVTTKLVAHTRWHEDNWEQDLETLGFSTKVPNLETACLIQDRLSNGTFGALRLGYMVMGKIKQGSIYLTGGAGRNSWLANLRLLNDQGTVFDGEDNSHRVAVVFQE
ncbi:MAG: hypothetical protein MRY49_00655 [Candidatus Pacebacteria bacterium]|nr:hypothetical protein [Candidatus Paceibacterota bacterium]